MSKPASKYTFRRLFNDIHLWLGVGSGLILFIVCLTGTIYTFRHEFEQALEPEKYKVDVPSDATILTADELIAKIEAKTGGKVTSLSIPADKENSYSFSVKMSPEERRGTGYFINPYTGEILGTQGGKVSEFFVTVMRLHRWLLIEGDVGKIIVGISTIIFVFLIFSGLIIWVPKKAKNWKQGLKIKFNANWKRVNHDLHSSLGFYSAILLLIMALTGLCWSFGWYRDGLSDVLGAKVFGGRGVPPAQAEIPADTTMLSISEILSISSQELSYKGDFRVSLPDEPGDAVVIYKNKTGFFASSGADKLQLSPYTGEVLKVEKFSDKPFNEKITASIKPLHTGEIFGLFSKIIYFITCLIATSLPVTGVIIWINKLKKKSRKKKDLQTKNIRKNKTKGRKTSVKVKA